MSDQAARLRTLMAAHRDRGAQASDDDSECAIAVLGSRHGVGTTSTVAFLREALWARQQGGWRVLELPSGPEGARAAAALGPAIALVVTSVEASAVLGAYAALKMLARCGGMARVGVVVNRAPELAAATAVAGRVVAVARRFLDVTIDLLGRIPADPAIPAAAVIGGGLRATRPLGAAARAFDDLARAIGPAPTHSRTAATNGVAGERAATSALVATTNAIDRD